MPPRFIPVSSLLAGTTDTSSADVLRSGPQMYGAMSDPRFARGVADAPTLLNYSQDPSFGNLLGVLGLGNRVLQENMQATIAPPGVTAAIAPLSPWGKSRLSLRNLGTEPPPARSTRRGMSQGPSGTSDVTDIARQLPSGSGEMRLQRAVEALGGRVLTTQEAMPQALGARTQGFAAQGTQETQGLTALNARLSGVDASRNYIPMIERIVGPDGQRIDPSYLYEYAKEWYRDAAMRAHPDTGGTEAAMKAVNAGMAFVEKHYGPQAIREALNPKFFAR